MAYLKIKNFNFNTENRPKLYKNPKKFENEKFKTKNLEYETVSLDNGRSIRIPKGTFTIFDKILNFHGVVNLIITR